MADVLILCVREDEQKAKAIAEMFEAAGFSIGGAPSNDAAVHAAGAAVVVWSAASVRSRPFHDAEARLSAAGIAANAYLANPPTDADKKNGSFDLSRWEGDANDPTLDDLFFYVDRLVNIRRGSDAGSQTPQSASPAPAPKQADMSSEADHWRTIRDSRNPADFLHYLTRFGPQGLFSEVAELRLKQLESSASSYSSPLRRPTVQAVAPKVAPAKRAKIFISYRRADTEAVSGRLCDRLMRAFSQEDVFFDVDTLNFGVDFGTYITEYIEQSRVLIAVIGENWIGRQTDGSAKIREVDDWVRREIEIALEQQVKVLPVLIGSAKMPDAAELPDTIRRIRSLNAAPLSPGRDFHGHVDRLIEAIKRA